MKIKDMKPGTHVAVGDVIYLLTDKEPDDDGMITTVNAHTGSLVGIHGENCAIPGTISFAPK